MENQLIGKLSMKKLAIIFTLLLTSVSLFAETGTIGGIRYEYKNGYATVIQSGGKKYSGRIVIPEKFTYNGKFYTVTGIGAEAFSHCESLTEIELPSSIKEIGNLAFLWCTGLNQINIPDSVKNISSDAFELSKNLPVYNGLRYADSFLIEAADSTATDFVVRSGTRWIGDNAFSNCSQLKVLSLPESVEVIGNFSLASCTSLSSLELPSSVRLIGMQAFAFSGLKKLTCKSKIPPVVLRLNDRNGYFDYVDTHRCRLKVGRGNRDAYIHDVRWREFRHIRTFRQNLGQRL